MHTTNDGPLWQNVKSVLGFGGAKSARLKMEAAAKIVSTPFNGEVAKTAPAAGRAPANYTVRAEVSRFDPQLNKMVSHFVLTDCKGHTPSDAIQNLVDQLKSGAAKFR